MSNTWTSCVTLSLFLNINLSLNLCVWFFWKNNNRELHLDGFSIFGKINIRLNSFSLSYNAMHLVNHLGIILVPFGGWTEKKKKYDEEINVCVYWMGKEITERTRKKALLLFDFPSYSLHSPLYNNSQLIFSFFSKE